MKRKDSKKIGLSIYLSERNIICQVPFFRRFFAIFRILPFPLFVSLLQKPSLLRPKGIGEQPDKQILAVAAGIRCVLYKRILHCIYDDRHNAIVNMGYNNNGIH